MTMTLSGLLKCSLIGLIGLVASLSAVDAHPRAANTEFQAFHSHQATRRIASPHKAINMSVPIDHFHNESIYEPHSHDSFPLRYWFDAKHYREGGPVIVLASGETSGEGRLPFLDYGIVAKLAEATGGIGVVLEHRYYGASFPVPDLSAKNMRFLSTEQALADTAYFAQHVKFPGLEHLNLTAPNAPYLIYGGSYAGAFAAFARKVYPDVFWGAIGSSAVTEAIVDYWEYYEAAHLFAPGECAPITQKLTHIIDNILLGGDKKKAQLLKDVFGLGELRDADFANVLIQGISGLQGTNWDPAEDGSDFGYYCSSITTDDVLFASTRSFAPIVRDLVKTGGYAKETKSLTNYMLNYIGYVRSHTKSDCSGQTIPECYANQDQYNNIGLANSEGRAWTYQTCTQWGYFQTSSGVPKGQLPLISRLIDLEFTTTYCRKAFNITTPPNIDSINKLGGFGFSYPRVAFIDGAYDPWRAATPHRIGLPPRASTSSEPFVLIDYGVHHWDENGLRPGDKAVGLPPPSVKKAQEEQVTFVKEWLKEWKAPKAHGEEYPGEL